MVFNLGDSFDLVDIDVLIADSDTHMGIFLKLHFMSLKVFYMEISLSMILQKKMKSPLDKRNKGKNGLQ